MKADIICFSCYIWNIEAIFSLADSIKKISPSTIIIVGGPEVSSDAFNVLKSDAGIDSVIVGEGEEPFAELINCFTEKGILIDNIKGISGIAIKGFESDFIPQKSCLPLSSIPFIYTEDNIDYFRNKIIYYEASRGCPFSCGYCLSSASKTVRSLPISRIKNELSFFLQKKVKQVKLIDRTFNYDRKRANEIWEYLIENDNGETNFHFEIEAHLLTDEQLLLLTKARRGLFQFECGVQSTNMETLKAVNRHANFKQLSQNIEFLRNSERIHLHLDLIAALPYESYEQFSESFNDVYSLRPHNLQLGFLKLLKGTALRDNATEYGIEFMKNPPYEALKTNSINFFQIARLRAIENIVELYYNSYRGFKTLPYVVSFFSSPFEFYEMLADYWIDCGYHLVSHSKMKLYEILFDFCEKNLPPNSSTEVGQLLKLDMCLDDNIKSFPYFLAYENSESYHTLKKELAISYNMVYTKACAIHTFVFDGLKNIYLFDYQHPRDVITNRAYFIKLED